MARKAPLGIFIGRFQPLHKGHLSAIRYSLSMCSTLVIGIGSSQESGTASNPLSFVERMQIIKEALKGAKINLRRIKFLAMPDFHNNEKWFNYIIGKIPKVGIVFSRNKLVIRIFKGHGIETARPDWHKRHLFKADSIRKRIRAGRDWKERVPSGAVKGISLHEEKIISSVKAKKEESVRVIIGGTFGYLHKGHIALIRKAFEVGDFVYVGLTTDKYVKNVKPYKMPRYSDRKRALVKLLSGFGKKYSVKPLSDKYGPSLIGNFDIIVVSAETFPTAMEINRIRKRKKLKPLSIVKIKYVLGDDSVPISTSRIIRGEIDKNGKSI